MEAYAAHHNRVFYVVATLGGTKSDGSLDIAVRQWLSTHYVLSGQVAASGVIVFLYSRPPQSVASGKASALTPFLRGPTASIPFAGMNGLN